MPSMKALNWDKNDQPDFFRLDGNIYVSPKFWDYALAALLDGDQWADFALAIGDDGCWAVALRLPDQIIPLTRPPSCAGIPAAKARIN